MLSVWTGSGIMVPVKVWKFPCGEVGVKVEYNQAVQTLFLSDVMIHCAFESNDDLIALAQLVDIVRRDNPHSVRLNIPYFPYSRQDRRVNEGEAHALKVVAAVINSLGFDMVFTKDPHSTVLEAVVDRLYYDDQADCARKLPKFDFLIAPDAGAEKKVHSHRQVKEQATMVLTATKQRNADGKIVKTEIANPWQVTGKSICIVDDLCDGGATFLELGKVLKTYDPKDMCLYVTHGMFTNGAKFVELNDLFDRIFVHNLCNKNFAQYVEVI